jgi:hypothetical protein
MFQPLGGQRGRIVLTVFAGCVMILALVAIQSVNTAPSDTRRERAGKPAATVIAASTSRVATESIQPFGATLSQDESYRCGLACTEEVAAWWRARTEPDADLDAIDRAFSATVRTALNNIEQALVDAAGALP